MSVQCATYLSTSVVSCESSGCELWSRRCSRLVKSSACCRLPACRCSALRRKAGQASRRCPQPAHHHAGMPPSGAVDTRYLPHKHYVTTDASSFLKIMYANARRD